MTVARGLSERARARRSGQGWATGVVRAHGFVAKPFVCEHAKQAQDMQSWNIQRILLKIQSWNIQRNTGGWLQVFPHCDLNELVESACAMRRVEGARHAAAWSSTRR